MQYIISKGWPDSEWTELSADLDNDAWLESLDELLLIEEGKSGFEYKLEVKDGEVYIVDETYDNLSDMKVERFITEEEVENYAPLRLGHNYHEALYDKADRDAQIFREERDA